MVDFKKAKALFSHNNANFQQAHEGAVEKGRKKCFENSKMLLEKWKLENRNRPLTVKQNRIFIRKE